MSEKGKKKAAAGGKKKGKTSSQSGGSSPRSPKKGSRSGSPKLTTEEKPSLPTEPYVPLPVRLPSICLLHNKPYELYSYARDQLLCKDCAPMHQPAVPVEEAFRYKLGQVYNLLNNYLYAKKTRLAQQLTEVESRMDAVKEVKMVIERDMRSEFASMNERLGAVSGSKEAALEHFLADTDSDLDRIQHIIKTMDETSTDVVGFMRKHGELRDLCELALAKPVRMDLNVNPNDYPKEMSEVREAIDRFPALLSLSEFKNEAIYRLAKEFSPPESIDGENEAELTEWIKLTDKFAMELSHLQLVCDYCSLALDEQTVNSNCPKNSSDSRHFFSKPKQPSLPSFNVPKDRTPVSKPQMQDPDPFSFIRMLIYERKIDLEQLFRSRDLLNTGVLDPTEFHQVLCNRLGLTSSLASEFALRYDVSRTGRVQYFLFLKDVMMEQYDTIDKLRKVIGKLSEDMQEGDLRHLGSISIERFRDILRRHGFSLSEVQLALQLSDALETGEVKYRSFVERVKVGQC